MNGRPSAFNRLYACASGRALLSGVLACAFLLALSRVQTIAYLTNDDNAVAWTLAGYQTGEPFPVALFINSLLGHLVSALYRLCPTVAWWAAVQLFALGAAITSLGACLLAAGYRRGAPLPAPLAVHASLLLLLLAQPVIQLTYTVTAAVLGAAGVLLALTAFDPQNDRPRTGLCVLSVAFLLFSYLMRDDTGYCALCFFAGACALPSLSAAVNLRALPSGDAARASMRRAALRPLAALLAALLLTAAAWGANRAENLSVNGADYLAFYRYREQFTDFPRDTYGQNPALYESVGWNDALSSLAEDWCFMDVRINADTLRAITEGSRTGSKTLSDALDDCAAFVRGEPGARWALVLTALFLLYAVAAFLHNRGNRLPFALTAAYLLGALVLTAYLCLRGRFMLRTFQVIAIPLLFALGLLSLQAYEPKRFRVFCALLVVFALLGGYGQLRRLRSESPKDLIADSDSVCRYAIDHPDNVYIRDAYSVVDIDAFTTYPDQKPTNLLSWGGCGMRSAAHRAQLALNGLSTPYADAFFEDGVYFLTNPAQPALSILTSYLADRYGDVSVECADDLDNGFAVYRFSKS